MTNLFKKLGIKFHQNRPSFVKDIMKNILVFFYRTQCKAARYTELLLALKCEITVLNVKVASVQRLSCLKPNWSSSAYKASSLRLISTGSGTYFRDDFTVFYCTFYIFV